MSNIVLLARPGSDPALRGAVLSLSANVRIPPVSGALAGLIEDAALVVFDPDGFEPPRVEQILVALHEQERPFVVVSANVELGFIRELFERGARDFISKPVHPRGLIMRLNAVLFGKKRIVSLGGGTGLFTLLDGLKSLANTLLIPVVSMSDDGGSSGKLRTSFGVLPPGDVRRSLVALSNAPELMNHVMQFRFEGGHDLTGHSVGNLILTALAKITGTMPQAVRALGDILNVQGVVMCVTGDQSTLCARFADGRIVRGESAVDLCENRPHDLRLERLWLEPVATCTPDAYSAILAADLITIGPGDLYTSIVANLAVYGIAEALRASRGEKLYVCNLMTKPGETAGYTAQDHVQEILRYLGADVLDYVITSSSSLDPKAVEEYAQKNQHPVRVDLAQLGELTGARVIDTDVGDQAKLVRHDGHRLREEIAKILYPPRFFDETSDLSQLLVATRTSVSR